MNTAARWLTGLAVAIAVGAACNLDGPTDIEAAQDTAARLQTLPAAHAAVQP